MSNINNRLLLALNQQPVDATPVWIMRQAGRYLPEYRATRAKAGNFLSLCKTPELACEVTMQPLRRFNLDAAILFSDILTIPDAMGLGLYFVEGEGPQFQFPLSTAADIHQLPSIDPERELSYVTQAVRLIKHELNNRLPLIGFSGSPWTLACYMMEGKSSKNFLKAKQCLKESPIIMHELLTKLSVAVADYLKAQIAAGVDVVMIFDTWGGMLGEDYEEFSLRYMRKIVAELNAAVPVVLFSKGANQHLELIAKTGCQGISVDWNIDLSEVRRRVGSKVTLQGNMNPSILLESPEKIRAEVQRILQDYGDHPGHIFNLGHGITPDIPPENVAVLVDAVHEFSQ
jgi:uroporphyrinogen decarboxylase